MFLLYLTCFTLFDAILLFIMKADLKKDIKNGLVKEELIGLVSIDDPDWAQEIYILETTHSKKCLDEYRQKKWKEEAGPSPSPPDSPVSERRLFSLFPIQ